MKTYNLGDLAGESGGEYVLGLKDLKTHAVYIVYGFLGPGEGGKIKMRVGEALHLREDDEYYLRNDGSETAHYVLAGGHPPVKHA
jgi:hypothetical protein